MRNNNNNKNNLILQSARFANLTVHLLPSSSPPSFCSYHAPRQLLYFPAALAHGFARLREIGPGRHLNIENLSSTQDLFIRAGDPVPSDSHPPRCFVNDLIIAAESGWTRVRYRQLRQVPVPVIPAPGEEHRTEDYLRALGGLADETPHAAAAVFALHGEFRRAELFATADLFRQCWPGLLRAAVREAVSAMKEEGDATPAGGNVADQERVLVWLAATRGPKVKHNHRPISRRVIEITSSTAEQISVATLDQGQGKICVHRSVIAVNPEGSTGQ